MVLLLHEEAVQEVAVAVEAGLVAQDHLLHILHLHIQDLHRRIHTVRHHLRIHILDPLHLLPTHIVPHHHHHHMDGILEVIQEVALVQLQDHLQVQVMDGM